MSDNECSLLLHKFFGVQLCCSAPLRDSLSLKCWFASMSWSHLGLCSRLDLWKWQTKFNSIQICIPMSAPATHPFGNFLMGQLRDPRHPCPTSTNDPTFCDSFNSSHSWL